jgi:hypothetical protein
LCSGLARRPLKAVARVRIPSGLQELKKDPKGSFFLFDNAFVCLIPPWHKDATRSNATN